MSFFASTIAAAANCILTPKLELEIFNAYQNLSEEHTMQNVPTLSGQSVGILDYRYENLRKNSKVILDPNSNALLSSIVNKLFDLYERPEKVLVKYKWLHRKILGSKALEAWIPKLILFDVNLTGLRRLQNSRQKKEERRMAQVKKSTYCIELNVLIELSFHFCNGWTMRFYPLHNAIRIWDVL